jgi:Scaffold protein Nfu/NifU N terminal
MFIQTEATPNPATLKFLPGRPVLPDGVLDIPDAAQAAKSPLAERLFAVPGVTGVFLGSDFITVTKAASEWQQIKPAILGAIMEHFMSGAPMLATGAGAAAAEDEFFEAKDADTVATIKKRSRRGCARRSPMTAATSPFAASRTASSIST